jgi:hypothetical protein
LTLPSILGNRAMQRLLETRPRVGRPTDPAEQEADSVADQVTRRQAAAGTPGARHLVETRFGVDLGGVRLHTDESARRMTGALGAAAFTCGADIWLRSPESVHDERLVAHELAHVVQQRRAPGSPPRIQRQAFPGETPEQEARRRAAIRGARNAIAQIERALRKGHLWPFETLSGSDIQIDLAFSPGPRRELETQKVRQNRLTTLVRDLWRVVIRLEGGRIPARWLQDEIVYPGGRMKSHDADVEMFYGHHMHARGMNPRIIWLNWRYIHTDPLAQSRVKAVPEPGELALGRHLVIEDPEHRPLEWQTSESVAIGQGLKPEEVGEIVEVRKDRIGYFYRYKGRKHYLPDYPG